MSADWFCKIGEKKVGPLNGQQLKTIVAKGQLKPEHLVRRGDEGPWVPAGRIKGLFPSSSSGSTEAVKKSAGKPLPKAAKGGSLPAAVEAPTPPASEIPQELSLGGHDKHHVQMNVDKFDIETTPVMVSRKKMRGGLKGLKKSEQKKAKVFLISLIGGGSVFVILVLIWAIATNKFGSDSKSDKSVANEDSASAPANTAAAKPVAETKTATKPEENTWPRSFKTVSVQNTAAGNVEVMVLKPQRGPKPDGIKSADSEVLIVPVNLSLKEGVKKNVEFNKGWDDEHVKKDVMLKDDEEGKGNRYDFLGQTVKPGDDAKEITDARIRINLIFELPSGKMPKTMYLALPQAALHSEGPMIAYKFNSSDVSDAPKTAAPSASPAPGAAAAGDKDTEHKDAEHKDGAK